MNMAKTTRGRTWGLLLVAIVTLVATADAAALPKARHFTPTPTAARLRQGGDTIAAALVIPEVPFSDTGSTVGYADDYEVGCGFDPDAAPDVVYSFIPPMAGYYTFDLCGSAYDVKLGITDYNGNVFACNDDRDIWVGEGDLCELDSRLADIWCDNHNVYYLIIDGYFGDAGDYVLAVTQTAAPCAVSVPGGSVPEGEPAITFAGVDVYNSGCVGEALPTIQVIEGDEAGEASLALVTGWRRLGLWDEDWFQFTAGPGGSVHVEIESDIEIFLAIITPADCNEIEWVANSYRVAACDLGAADFPLPAGNSLMVQVHPRQPAPPLGQVPVSFNAVLNVSGLAVPLAVETSAWGTVKGMFR
jgi:hypothetical protein